jgi:hypothetical protein
MKNAIRTQVTILAFLCLVGGPLGANGSWPHPAIGSASVEGGVLVIRGQNFGHLPPYVSLGGIELAKVTRVSGSEVRATLPDGIAPGTYRLMLARNPGKRPFSSLDVTIGAVGPMGPAGAKGDEGDRGPQGLPGPGLETGQVSGRLVSCTPRDFDGAVVHLPGRSFQSITGTSGEFELSYVPPGSYDVVATQAGSRLVSLSGVTVSATSHSDLGDVQTTKLESDSANCGSCGNACGTGTSCVGGTCVCVPTTCAARNWNCGTAPDGCGGTLDCGTCTSGLTCGGGGVGNRCGSDDDDPCFFREPPDAARIIFCCTFAARRGLKIPICP